MASHESRLERELGAHAAWVRALARNLVRDDASAEDLAQDAWLAAVRHPAAEGVPMRAWLGSVVRRMAWKRARDARSSRTETSGALHLHGGDDPELLERLERLELHELLAAELRSLREPLRSTLLERYFEGRSAAEIAERTGVPAPTVRYRLQEGLEELRSKLDRRFGGKRETWMSALAFAFPSKGTVLGGTGVAIGEGLLVSTLVKVMLGVAALVAVVMLALPHLWNPEPLPSSALASAPEAQGAQPEGATAASSLSTPDVPENARAGVPSARAAAAPDTSSGTFLVARFLDGEQHPIANAWLRLKRWRADATPVSPQDEARSGPDGIARLEWREARAGYETQFEAGAAGYASLTTEGTPVAGKQVDLGDLVLRPGGSVRGRVVDAEGLPIPGAEVAVSPETGARGAPDLELIRNRGPETSEGTRTTTSARDGSYCVDGLEVGGSRAWARSANYRWTVSPPIDIAARSQVDGVVLVIDRTGSADPELADIEGLVLDPQGHPVRKPCIFASQSSRGSSWGDRIIGGEDGRFRIQPKARGARISLEVSDQAERFAHANLADVKAGTKSLEVRLSEPRTLVLQVRDESGPVEHFRVSWGTRADLPATALLSGDEGRAGGRASVRVPAESFWYWVESKGHRKAKVGPVDGRTPPEVLAVDLQSVASVRGRVLAGGRPFPGATLRLCEQPENYRCIGNGYVVLVRMESTLTTSDAEGRFALDLEQGGRYSVFADAPGFARAQLGPIEISGAEGLADAEIQLGAGGTLEGRVLMPSGRSPAGVTVGINRGDGTPLVRTVEADGLFRFEHLTPGPFEMRQDLPRGTVTEAAFPKDKNGKWLPVVIRPDFTIVEGETTHKDLDLRDPDVCELEIELTRNSEPARSWMIEVQPKGGGISWGSQPSVATDARGHATLPVEFVGECVLLARPPVEMGSGLELRVDLELQRGSNRWVHPIRTGRLEGSVKNWDPAANWGWYLRAEEASICVLRPDAAGRFVEPCLPAGTISVYRSHAGVCEPDPKSVKTFELRAGETTTLELP